MRALHTIEVLCLDYPEGFSSPSETCYTCDFKLDRHTTKAGERVIKCTRCNKCEIHESCYRNCRTCEDLQLIWLTFCDGLTNIIVNLTYES